MNERTSYVAIDGKLFLDKDACLEYEYSLFENDSFIQNLGMYFESSFDDVLKYVEYLVTSEYGLSYMQEFIKTVKKIKRQKEARNAG